MTTKAVNKFIEEQNKKATKAKEFASNYFSNFNDLIAEQFEWHGIGGSSVFKMYSLTKTSSSRLELKISKAHKIIWGTIAAFGILALLTYGFIDFEPRNFKSNPNTLLYMGIGFLIIGILVPLLIKKKVFDKSLGYFWIGKKNLNSKNEKKLNLMRLGNIHAIQLIRVVMDSKSKNSNTVCNYELNLLLKNLKRIHLTSDFNGARLLNEGKLIAEFIERPLWNACCDE